VHDGAAHGEDVRACGFVPAQNVFLREKLTPINTLSLYENKARIAAHFACRSLDDSLP
jgi:hypothetical protein